MARKLKKDILDFTKAGVGLGIGTTIVSGAGGSTAGLGAMGGMMAPVGSAMMGGHAIRMLGKLQPKKRRRKR